MVGDIALRQFDSGNNSFVFYLYFYVVCLIFVLDTTQNEMALSVSDFDYNFFETSSSKRFVFSKYFGTVQGGCSMLTSTSQVELQNIRCIHRNRHHQHQRGCGFRQ
jgi:hypothetical protein